VGLRRPNVSRVVGTVGVVMSWHASTMGPFVASEGARMARLRNISYRSILPNRAYYGLLCYLPASSSKFGRIFACYGGKVVEAVHYC